MLRNPEKRIIPAPPDAITIGNLTKAYPTGVEALLYNGKPLSQEYALVGEAMIVLLR